MPASQLYGTLTRKLYDIWRQASVFSVVGNHASNAATGLLGQSNAASASVDSHRFMVTEIQRLFHGIDVYPTESQVFEMIQCASRCSLSRSPPNKANSADPNAHKECLTFGEFCFFASVLINSYRQNIPPPKPLSKNDAFFRKLERAHQSIPETGESTNDTSFEVFLGGSCNPTQWRTQTVIPEFKRLGITYYNPQVEQWGPELIELECYAKQNSEILFFVVDNQTRAIASMIEVAFLAATQRKLILVINDLPGPKCKIVNDELSHEEYEMLSKGRAFLRDAVERQGIPIFGSIDLAVKATVRVLRDNIWPQDLTRLEDEVTPVKMGHVTLGDKMIRMFNQFNSLKNNKGQFTFAELAHAYRTLTNRVLPLDVVKQLARCHMANHGTDSNASSPSLSRSSSSDEPEEEHFEVVAAAPAMPSGKKPKGRGKKNRKMKKLQDIFPSDSGNDSLPPLNEIVINFDQFCCIISELNEKSRLVAEQAANGTSDVTDGNDRSLLQFPGKVLEKVGSLFNVFSIIKTMLSIPVEEQQHSSTQAKVDAIASNDFAVWTPQVQSNFQHPLHPSRLHRVPSLINNSFPSRSSSPGLFSRDSSSLPRHSPLPHVDANQYASSYSVSGTPNGSMAHHHLRSHGRSASPNLFRHRHSYSSPSPNHLAPHHHPLAGHQYHHQSSHSPMRESPLLPLRRGFHSSTSSITSLLYDNYTDLYIGGCLEESFLHHEIIPLLKKYSITFSTLKADRWTSQRMIPLEAKNIEKSRVLLFLITKNSIDISFMIMAAHYVGLGYKVVLCIQNIDSSSPFVISDGKTETWLSTDAIKDYNRGRSYLSDLATKMGVPVFSDINESIQCCIEAIISSE